MVSVNDKDSKSRGKKKADGPVTRLGKGLANADPKRQTKYGTGLIGEMGNLHKDIARGTYNTVSDVTNFITGNTNPLFNRMGDRIVGQKKKQTAKSPPDWTRARQPSEQTEALEEEVVPEMSFADYLAMANSLSGGGVDYSALKNRLQQNAGDGDARLNAMYSQLQKSFADDSAGIGQTYDQTAAAQQAAATQAADATNAGYDRARAAQTEQFRALGIGDAAATIASSGSGTGAGDQAFQNSNIAQLGGINQQQTQANKAGSLDYNTKITQAAGAEGATQRAQLQQALGNKLAELEVAESEANASRSDNNWEKASFLADWDNAAAQRRAASSGQLSLEDQLTQSRLANQDLKNQQLAQKLVPGADSGTALRQAQELAQQYGVDPSNFEQFSQFLEAVAASKKL